MISAILFTTESVSERILGVVILQSYRHAYSCAVFDLRCISLLAAE